MKEEKVHFSTPAGKLAGIIHHPDHPSSSCVITCHGLFSDKVSDKFISIGEHFAQEGITVLRFDFRGCGESDGKIEETTITGRREDLNAALSFIRAHKPSVSHTIGLLGSSMGGYISLRVASSDKMIKAVAAWATPFSFDGLREVIAHSDSPQLKEEFYQDADRYDASQFVPQVKNLLLIHGDKDETVPADHAERLYQKAREPKRLEIVRGADHIFSNPALRKKAIRYSLNWFKKHLIP
ncbi:MAG: alpha/beta fold hydrolase [Deltaproteobacteria bacterium]|nr:alpha/beta fold hydrolase [Deltaproteobacteria bacterium]